MTRTGLRQGFTTGTAAAAAAMAAVKLLATGRCPACVSTPLPEGGELDVPVAGSQCQGPWARAWVVKDGGDDPDATSGAEIHAICTHFPDLRDGEIILKAGIGIGKVTLPGLALAVGEAAINAAPRRQITLAAQKALAGTGLCGGLRVVLEVPDGEAIAARTMNARLGILGGISILGNSGIVRPFSHESWAASITQALSVARAAGLSSIVFSTGRRTERLFLEEHPETHALGTIQAADFFGHANREAARQGFASIRWSVFFGKLVKQAMGLENTHANEAGADLQQLAAWCAEAGAGMEAARQARQANTARHVLEMLEGSPALPRLLDILVFHACEAARSFAGPLPHIGYAVFDFDGRRLA